MTKLKKDSATTQSINAAQVRDYLAVNTNFFNDNRGLLEKLTIPDDRGVAVSLITKQVEFLRNKNVQLTQKLDELLTIAHSNDQLFQRIHKLTIAVFSKTTLEDTIESLKSVLFNNFNADFVEVRVIVDNEKQCQSDLFVMPTDKQLAVFQSVFENHQPICGRLKALQREFFFGKNADSVKSAAIVPLDYPCGSGLLAIGSRDENRFQADMGHIFLINIAELISLRLSAFLEQQD